MLVNFISEEEERCYGLPMDAIILVFLCNRCQETLGSLCMLCSVQHGLLLDFITLLRICNIIKVKREVRVSGNCDHSPVLSGC